MTIANTTIQLKKSGAPGNSPTTLNYGELAINYADGKLYYKNALGAIASISTGGGGGGSSNSFSTIVSNGSVILATSPTDILSLTSNNGIIISTDTISKTINLDASGILNFAHQAYNQANSKTYTWYQSTAPAAANVHDLWMHSDTAKVYENIGNTTNSLWIEFGPTADTGNLQFILNTQNTVISNAYTEANVAYNLANSAFAAANAGGSGAFSQAAFDRANNSLALTGGTVSGNVIVNGLSSNVYVKTPTISSFGGGSVIHMTDFGIIGIETNGTGITTKFVNSNLELNGSVYGGSYGGNYLKLNNQTTLGSDRYDTVKIQTGTSGTPNNIWSFANSQLIFPDNTSQNTAFTDAFAAQLSAPPVLPIIELNSTNITSNVVIGTNYNGFSVGPVLINNGASVTITNGQRWVII
jgi:hypothetical protein